MRIFAWVFAVLLFGQVTSAWSQTVTVDLSKLPPAVQQQVERTLPQTQTLTDKWQNIGKSIGVAVVSAATQLGIAANQFAQTPLGKLTVLVIIYKIVGISILHGIVALVLMVAALWSALRITSYVLCGVPTRTRVPVLWGLFHRNVKTGAQPLTGDQQAGYTFVAVILFMVAVAIGVNTFT